jgi:hypothetical protein
MPPLEVERRFWSWALNICDGLKGMDGLATDLFAQFEQIILQWPLSPWLPLYMWHCPIIPYTNITPESIANPSFP